MTCRIQFFFFVSYLRQQDVSFAACLTFATVLTRKGKGKGLPQQADMPQGVPGRLRPRIFLTFGTTRVVGRQPYAPAAFTPGEINRKGTGDFSSGKKGVRA